VLQKIWGLAEELQLTQNNLSKLLLAIEKCENITIYQAACMGIIVIGDIVEFF